MSTSVFFGLSILDENNQKKTEADIKKGQSKEN
jgi:hypothetical protein